MKKSTVIICAIALMGISLDAVAAGNLNIAVLCYHDVSNNPFKWQQYCISGDEIEADLKYFTEHGYTFLKPDEMWYASSENKNIVLTFDDGYEGMYDIVFPLLKEYSAKAAVYIIGSEIDKKGFLSPEEIREMDESGLVEIGNHTTIAHTWGYNADAYKNDPVLLNDFAEDVKDCSSRIYTILGHGTESLAYPSGQYTTQMDNIVRTNLGYTTTFSTNYGIVKTQNDILKPMPRIYRNHNTDPDRTEQKINKLK